MKPNLSTSAKQIILALSTAIYALISPIQVMALSTAQRDVLLSGIDYFNVEDDICRSDGLRSPEVGNNNIYVIGDSLTVGMESVSSEFRLSTVLKNKGWNPTINAQGSRPLWYSGASQKVSRNDNPNATVTSAFYEFEQDKATIAAAGAAVVSLGTNSGSASDSEYKTHFIEYIDMLRQQSPKIVIYIVNMHTASGGQESRNAVIKQVVAEKSVKLIDYRSVAEDEVRFPWGDTEKVHLTGKGYQNKAAFIAEQVGQAPTPSSQGLSAGSKIYMVGSSATVLSKTYLESGIVSAGYVVSKINAENGRSIKNSVEGGTSAIEAVTADKSIIAGSGAVIVAIFDGDDQSWDIVLPELITKIREANQSARIYIATYFTASDTASANNSTINNLAGPQGFTAINTSNSGIAVSGDGINPTNETLPNFANAIVGGIKSGVDNTAPNVTTTAATPGQPTSIDLSGITWGSGVWSSGSSKFVSGFEGPYTLEYWAISVLKNLARKAGKDESTMVTPAKVLSLVVFAKTEGGGYEKHNGTYNPLNKKGAYTDIPGANQGNSANDSNSEGYTTFDDGVEAISRGLFGTYQKRVGGTLLDPNMTPAQFMEAVTGNFYVDGVPTNDASKVKNGWESTFKDDKAWAAASITNWVYNPSRDVAEVPPATAKGIGNRETHLKTKMESLNYVKQNYEKSAGIVLDMPNRTPDTRTPPPLQYSAADMSGLVSTVGVSSSCTSANSSDEASGAVGNGGAASDGSANISSTSFTGPVPSGAAAVGSYKIPRMAYNWQPIYMIWDESASYKCQWTDKVPAGANTRQGQAQPGTYALNIFVAENYGGGEAKNQATCKGNPVSKHGEGRARDSYFNAGNPDELKKGNELMGWMVANAQAIGLQYVKFWRVEWDHQQGINCVEEASDQSSHFGHVHWELNWDGALKKTPFYNGTPYQSNGVLISQEVCPVVK